MKIQSKSLKNIKLFENQTKWTSYKIKTLNKLEIRAKASKNIKCSIFLMHGQKGVTMRPRRLHGVVADMRFSLFPPARPPGPTHHHHPGAIMVAAGPKPTITSWAPTRRCCSCWQWQQCCHCWQCWWCCQSINSAGSASSIGSTGSIGNAGSGGRGRCCPELEVASLQGVGGRMRRGRLQGCLGEPLHKGAPLCSR